MSSCSWCHERHGEGGEVNRPALTLADAARIVREAEAVRDKSYRVPLAVFARLVSGQESLRDQGALLIFGRLGLRKNELRLVQIADIDLGRDELFVRHAKGGEEHLLPIGFPDVQ